MRPATQRRRVQTVNHPILSLDDRKERMAHQLDAMLRQAKLTRDALHERVRQALK
jgi:hypothetical protein